MKRQRFYDRRQREKRVEKRREEEQRLTWAKVLAKVDELVAEDEPSQAFIEMLKGSRGG